MRPLAEFDSAIDAAVADPEPVAAAAELLELSEEMLEHWIDARGLTPTDDTREGFRLVALHRQGSKGDPSFNACRETCRELAYHYNLITMKAETPASVETTDRVAMMGMISRHLFLFVSGKLEVSGLGEFCCASKPLRNAETEHQNTKEA